MKGRLALRVGLDDGRSVIRHCGCEFPLVALRPQSSRDGTWLSLVVLTPSGGLLEGDELEGEVVVEDGARLELRTQAATQLHRGRSAQSWRLSVGAGAWLSYVPQPLSPHAGAVHHSSLAVEVTETSAFFLGEMVSPGRTHRGERFAYDELRLDLDVWRAGTLVARERQRIRPSAGGLETRLGTCSYFGSAYVFGGSADSQALFLASDAVEAGVTKLAYGGYCLRLLAQRAYDMEQALAIARARWSASTGTRAPSRDAVAC